MTSGGCPGLQAGEDSGAPRSGAAGPAGGTRGAPPALLRSCVRYWNGEDSLPVPGIPRPGPAADAEPHLRLHPRGLEPDPGRPARPLAGRPHQHLLRPDRRRADPHEEGPGPGVPYRGLLCAAAAGAPPPAPGVHRVLRETSPLPAVQVPPRPPGRALHPPRLHAARRGAAAGQDGRPAAVHLVLARRRRGRAGPHDGGRVPGAGRPLVRDLCRRHRCPRAAGAGRARGRRRPGRDGPRRHLGRGEDRQPAAPGAQGPEPGPLPAAPGPLPERLREPGQGRS